MYSSGMTNSNQQFTEQERIQNEIPAITKRIEKRSVFFKRFLFISFGFIFLVLSTCKLGNFMLEKMTPAFGTLSFSFECEQDTGCIKKLDEQRVEEFNHSIEKQEDVIAILGGVAGFSIYDIATFDFSLTNDSEISLLVDNPPNKIHENATVRCLQASVDSKNNTYDLMRGAGIIFYQGGKLNEGVLQIQEMTQFLLKNCSLKSQSFDSKQGILVHPGGTVSLTIMEKYNFVSSPTRKTKKIVNIISFFLIIFALSMIKEAFLFLKNGIFYFWK